MKCYLAARYSRRQEIQVYAAALRGEGHEVTSRWLDGVHEAVDGDMRRWGEFAQDDLDDIAACDTLLSFTETGLYPRGSRHVEFGVALAAAKKLVVIGPVENVFMALPHVLQFNSWGDYMMAILDRPKGNQE
jgi:hypothetical protein